MSTHALLSASGSYRWVRCPASVGLVKDLPEATSVYAQEGTQAHEMAERLVNAFASARAEVCEALVKECRETDEEMFTFVNQYISELELIGDKPLSQYDCVNTEVRLPLSFITDEKNAFGTADCVIIDGTTLHVCDLKYGLGVPVSATKNTQLLMYAAAAERLYGVMYDIKQVVGHIIQPRLNSVSSWGLGEDAEVLLEELKVKAKHALSIVADPSLAQPSDFCPSEGTCQFCKGKAICPAIKAELEAVVMDSFEVIPSNVALPPKVISAKNNAKFDLPLPKDEATLGKAYTMLPVLRAWADAVEALAFETAMSGRNVPGFKLVAGRAGVRKWKDEDTVIDHLVNDYAIPTEYVFDLKSPAKLEKALKQYGAAGLYDELASYITRSDSKPRLVPETDKTPALARVEESFEVIA